MRNNYVSPRQLRAWAESGFRREVGKLLRAIEHQVVQAKEDVNDGDIESAVSNVEDIETQLAEIRRLIDERATALAGDQ